MTISHAMRILDEGPESRFERIVSLVKDIFSLSMAYVNLVDMEWLLGDETSAAEANPRSPVVDDDQSLTALTMRRSEPLIVPDAREDPRLAQNSMVTGHPFIVFYASVPLRGPNGLAVGTLTMADHEPRELSDAEVSRFCEIAELAESELNTFALIRMQRDLLKTKNELVNSQKQLDRELSEAAEYVRGLLPKPIADPIKIDWRHVSSSRLGGDALGYHWLEDGELAFYVIDVTGHGVGAALLSISVMNMIRSPGLTRPDKPDHVLRALNDAFPMAVHNKFFTAWYGVYDPDLGILQYAGGGHPPAILFSGVGEDIQMERLESNGLIVGVDPESKFETEKKTLHPGDRIYLFSDGVFEAFDPDEQVLGLSRFIEILRETPFQPDQSHFLDDVIRRVEAWQQRRGEFPDDVSIMEIQIT